MTTHGNPHDRDTALRLYREAAHAEADAHFDERALADQRARILDRLAHLGQSARVLPFPAATAPAAEPSRINRRWVAAAAAAGLVLGLLSGEFLHVVAPASRHAAAPSGALPGVRPATLVVVDDGLLGEVDSAVQLRTATELRVLDELTPFFEPR